MRGKNIILLTLIALLANATFTGIAFTQETPTTTMKIEPATITGHPGDSFSVDIVVENVECLCAYQFKIQYAPYLSVLTVMNVLEGPFMEVGSPPFTWNDDVFYGVLTVGSIILGMTGGSSGSGVIATVDFYVLEAGKSPIELFDTRLIDCNAADIPHETIDAYYQGPYADLVEGGKTWAQVVPPGNRRVVPGETQSFHSEVINYGDVPLYVKTTFDMWREDAEHIALGAGQWTYGFSPELPEPIYLYLYVDGYDYWNAFGFPYDFTHYGDPQYLDAVDYPTNYIEGNVMDEFSGAYTFEDLALEPPWYVSNVKLEGMVQYPGGADDNMDMDMLGYVPGWGAGWAGSLWGTDSWDWHTPRWIGEDLSDTFSPMLTKPGETADAVNDFYMWASYWTADGLSHGPMRLDSLRMKVELSYPRFMPLIGTEKVYVLEPGEKLILDPATWDISIYDTGKYYCTLTCWYSYDGIWFNPGDTVRTFQWKVVRSLEDG